MDVIVDNVNKEEITFEDFPFICRICLLRGDLRPFEGEDYLLDLFMSITQIDVHSTIDFPRNICNACVNKLEDISLSIDIWKYNCMLKKERGAIEDLKVDTMPVCIICSSGRHSMSFEADGKLSQLFRKITNIDMKNELASANGNGICSECIVKLEKISSFICLSLRTDGKLDFSVGGKKYVKYETYSDAIDIISSTSDGLGLEDVADNNEAMEENPFEKTISDYKIEEKQENIDIKEHVLDIDLSNSVSKTYRAELATPFSKFTLNFFPKQNSPHLAEEKFSQSNWPDTDTIRKSNSSQQMIIYTREKFECELCGKRFTRESSLQSHLLVCTVDKPFKCDCCQKKFIQKGYLNRHLRAHTGEKPFKCDCCKKSFSRKENLKIHSRTHTGEKTFKCDCCEKSFSRKENLIRHSRTHTGEKPFKCDYCKKSFSRKENLIIHSRTHTGEKPFGCVYCSEKFAGKKTLKAHMLIHTGKHSNVVFHTPT